MNKKSKILWTVLIFFILSVLVVFLFVPIKYNAYVKMFNNDLKSTVEIVILRNKKYIMEESLNNLIYSEEKETSKTTLKEYTCKDGENDIYMHLLHDKNSRNYLSYTYNLQTKEILGKKYLSIEDINKINNIELDLKLGELLIKKADNIEVSPQTALNIGIEAILYIYPEFDVNGAEYSLFVIEEKDVYTEEMSLKNAMGVSLAAGVRKQSGMIEKVYIKY